MKRIAIFCDGTWNRSDAETPTNVVRLSLAVGRSAPDGTAQQLIYLAGVGTGRGSTGWARRVDYWGGGIFGWGTTENIEEAYRHLAFNYELGDELFVFGFSRGAFTARSLCGLLRNCGIPTRDNVRRIPEAIARYRSRAPEDRPDSEESFRFRRGFSPWLYTSEAEQDWAERQGETGGGRLIVDYVGVWDTVGALGIPAVLPFASLVNRRYGFHDLSLSRMVLSARHAVAIDERRATYPPALWDNLDGLNGARGRGAYRQEWFPGDHGSVGGGGDVLGLSSLSLLWVVEGAAAAGLWVDPAALEPVRGRADATAPLSSRSVRQAGMLSLLSRWTADRKGPRRADDVSAAARRRWRAGLTPPYRPAPLAAVAAELDAGGEAEAG